MPSAVPESWDWGAYAIAFAERLVRLRHVHGWSQLDLAHRAGVTPNTVKLLELGRSSGRRPGSPQLQTVYKIAAALGVTPADLLPSASVVPDGSPAEARPDFAWPVLVDLLIDGGERACESPSTGEFLAGR